MTRRTQLIMAAAGLGGLAWVMSGSARPAMAASQSRPAGTVPVVPHGVILTVYSSADPASFNPRQWAYLTAHGYGAGQANPDQVPGFGVVKQVRLIHLAAGLNKVDFTDVAALIDPTSVSFEDLTVPATQVLQQQFKFDLANSDSVLARYIGHKISVRLPAGNRGLETVSGRLFHAGHSMILQTQHGIRILYPKFLQQVRLQSLPRGLITRPTLQWRIISPKAGNQEILTSYQTKGLTWIADYNLILGSADKHASLAAWVTLLNLSGKTYRQAHLKLIAGNVNRVQPPQYYSPYAMAPAGALRFQGFQQKKFFEYHLYTLPRRTTIPNNSTEQIALFATRRHIRVHKALIYSGQSPVNGYWNGPNLNNSPGVHSRGPVAVFICFQNSKANGMGIPLPRGKIRVFKEDPADSTLEFVGENLIRNTPRDSRISTKVGHAFDIIGSRTRTNFHIDNQAHILHESFRIVIRNHQNKQVDVQIPQYLYRWNNWKITRSSGKFKKINSDTIRFNVAVPKNGRTTIAYTVRYSW